MIHLHLSCSNPASQFLEIRLSIPCEASERLRLQLPAWRAGRYQLANYAQNLRGFKAQNEAGDLLPFRKTNKDRWELLVPEKTTCQISYSYWAGKMDAGSAWVDDEQIYVNFVNCCFEILDRQVEAIALSVDLPNYPQQVLTLPQVGPSAWKAADFQRLADATLLATKQLLHWTYEVGPTSFHLWIHGEVFFDSSLFISQFQAFSKRMISDFGEFPEPDYHFIFQLLPYPHYHGVEHRMGTVITFGPASSLADPAAMEEVLGISAHELYHAWNVCRIRPKEFLPYDFSSETYTQAGLLLEGVTTYLGDLYLLKSGVYSLSVYLKHLSNLLQRETTQLGWKNQSIEASSFDLWLDGYVAGIPDRKVNIYTRGALLALCLDVILLNEGSSLPQVIRRMWENYGAPFVGYGPQDFEKALSEEVRRPESIATFFDTYVRGTEDLFPFLERGLEELGLQLTRSWVDKPLLHQAGIVLNEQQLVERVHAESLAYHQVMANDRILNAQRNASSSRWELEIDRLGRKVHLTFEQEEGHYYPQYSVEEGIGTSLRETWIQ